MTKNDIFRKSVVINIVFFILLLFVNIVLMKRRICFISSRGESVMVAKKKNYPYIFKVRRNGKPIPEMTKEQYETAKESVAKYLLKTK